MSCQALSFFFAPYKPIHLLNIEQVESRAPLDDHTGVNARDYYESIWARQNRGRPNAGNANTNANANANAPPANTAAPNNNGDNNAHNNANGANANNNANGAAAGNNGNGAAAANNNAGANNNVNAAAANNAAQPNAGGRFARRDWSFGSVPSIVLTLWR